MTKQIKIEEDGEWKATVNLDETGKVVREWGKGEDIDKVIFIKKPSKEDIQKQIDDLQEMIDNFDENVLEEGVPQPTSEMLQEEINWLKELL